MRAVHHWFFLLQLCITLRVSPIHLMEPVLVLAVESIRCVQCTTDEDPSCAASPTLETHNCSVGMNHCVVYYGVFNRANVDLVTASHGSSLAITW